MFVQAGHEYQQSIAISVFYHAKEWSKEEIDLALGHASYHALLQASRGRASTREAATSYNLLYKECKDVTGETLSAK